MSTKLTLLEVLNQNTNTYLSGQQLADQLGVSRNAVWKAMKKLQDQGFTIESKAGTGYRLMEQSDIITKDYLAENLTVPCRIQIHDVLDSTNRVARELEPSDVADKPHLIIANEQTKGRGRLGRSFWSPPSTGLYMTLAFRPNFGLDKAMLITTIAAVAVCRAMDQVTGLRPKIKWVNDIYLGDKKVCGIMTEALRAVLREVFTVLKLHRVEAQHFSANPSSGRVMEKCGMTRVARSEEIPYRGAVHHCIFYEKSADR